MRVKENQPNLIFVSADPKLDSEIAEGVASSIRVHMAPEVRRTNLPKLITGQVVADYVRKAFTVSMIVNSMKSILTSNLPVSADYSIARGITQEKLNFWLNVAKVLGVPSGLTTLIDKVTAPVELADGSLVVVVPGTVQTKSSKVSAADPTRSSKPWCDPDLGYMLPADDRFSEAEVVINQLYKSTIGPSAPRTSEAVHYVLDPSDLRFYNECEDVALLAGASLRCFMKHRPTIEVLSWSGKPSTMQVSELMRERPFMSRVTVVSEGDEMEKELVRDWWMNCFING